ncbi:hypothetical protein Nepgr_028795 [Nepenthes gracilis]|uniref:Uncharacterized protein n=1 Tax=Nepenthes gracilis TaxID=150966 RepID=A0AAD3Y2F3_NEPGR|nr:hypothetical protein Nepgr_028795 [Nepenthes gracilis]
MSIEHAFDLTQLRVAEFSPGGMIISRSVCTQSVAEDAEDEESRSFSSVGGGVGAKSCGGRRWLVNRGGLTHQFLRLLPPPNCRLDVACWIDCHFPA